VQYLGQLELLYRSSGILLPKVVFRTRDWIFDNKNYASLEDTPKISP
jgi:hypothetical protein